MSVERGDRRTFLVGVGAAVTTLVGLTAGQSFDVLAPVNLFAPRVKGQGPQGLPVNRTAGQAGVQDVILDPAWRLHLESPSRSIVLSRDDLTRMPQAEAVLPIACVEGWSTTAHWRGVQLAYLLQLAGVGPDRTVRLESVQPRGPYRVTTMPPHYAWDPLTLVALELNGQTLDADHGFPCRIIAPGRPGVLQTKWLHSIREEPT
ncbi:molybdopterin-dependent oxidoreductase [Microbacterium trichothecenolyticum]|uniref:molybdopterin-dependent oxidoreductase n=1 Tax=Microbacterium trichothecenolyticum TaxID=69370 RepID=UPI0035BE329E